MYVPMPILVIISLLAAIPVTFAAAMFHHEMGRLGLCLVGRRDLYLDNHVLEERWCLLYVPLRKRIGCHSMASL